MGAKQKEGKQVASKNGPAAQADNGVTDSVTIANGQKVGATINCLQVLCIQSRSTCPSVIIDDTYCFFRVLTMHSPAADTCRHPSQLGSSCGEASYRVPQGKSRGSTAVL